MADHSEILPRLGAYHDGALPDVERTQVEQHLETCAECRARLSDWAALDMRLLELDEPALEPGRITDLVMSRIAVRSDGESVRSRWPGSHAGRRIAIGAAAAVLVLAAAGLWQRAIRSPEPASLATRSTPAQPAKPDVALEQPQETIPSAEAPGDQQIERRPAGENAALELAERDAAGGRESAASPAVKIESEKSFAAAPRPIRPEDSGIPQVPGGPARPAFDVDIHYRFYDRLDLEYVELNLVPVFEVEFTPVSYALVDRLAGQWDAANPEPMLLDPQEAYLVSNLRIERATLLSLVVNQAPTSDVRLRLAEVTWRLANLTADQDDVQSAISAQAEAMRQTSGAATELRGRLAYLRGLVR